MSRVRSKTVSATPHLKRRAQCAQETVVFLRRAGSDPQTVGKRGARFVQIADQHPLIEQAGMNPARAGGAGPEQDEIGATRIHVFQRHRAQQVA